MKKLINSAFSADFHFELNQSECSFSFSFNCCQYLNRVKFLYDGRFICDCIPYLTLSLYWEDTIWTSILLEESRRSGAIPIPPANTVDPSAAEKQLWSQLCRILTHCLPTYWPHGPFTPDYFLNKYNFYVNICALIQVCIQYNQASRPVDLGPVSSHLLKLCSQSAKSDMKRKSFCFENIFQTNEVGFHR